MLPPPKPDRRIESALEVEFEQTWEGGSDLDEEDFEAMRRSVRAGSHLPKLTSPQRRYVDRYGELSCCIIHVVMTIHRIMCGMIIDDSQRDPLSRRRAS